MNDKHDSDLNKAAQDLMRESLDRSIEHLDAHTLSRLNQARQRALEQAARPRWLDSQWLKAAAIGVLLVTVINGWTLFTSPDSRHPHADALELLVASDDFELAQDLDFVVWLIEGANAS